MTSIALFCGVNRYPFPNALQGCVNDANAMSAAIASWIPRAAHRLILDEAATTTAISTALRAAVAQLQPGDRFLFHFSGHGAQLRQNDISTDCLCPVDFDFQPEHALQVADLHDIFARIPEGVTARWVSDSCHSGDLEREERRVPGPIGKARVFQPARFDRANVARRTFTGAQLPNIVLVSGCKSSGTSADTVDAEGNPCGALTSHLTPILGSTSIALADLGPALCAALAADGYEQQPQITGRPDAVNLPFFAEATS